MTRLVPEGKPGGQEIMPSLTTDRLALAGPDGILRVVSPDLTSRAPIPFPDEGAALVAFSRDGARVALAEHKGVQLYSLAPTRALWSALGVEARSLELAPRGDALAWGEAVPGRSEARLHLITLEARGKRAPTETVVAADRPRIISLRFDPEARRLGWTSGDYTGDHGRLTVTDVASGKALWSSDHTAGSLSFSPDGTLLASGTSLLDATSGRVVRPLQGLEGNDDVRWLSFSADGKALCSMVRGAMLGVWHVDSGKPLWQRSLPVSSCTFGPHDQALVVVDRAALRVLEPLSGKERLRIHYASEASALATASGGVFERLGGGALSTVCLLGAQVASPQLCDAALGGARALWRWSVSGDASALQP